MRASRRETLFPHDEPPASVDSSALLQFNLPSIFLSSTSRTVRAVEPVTPGKETPAIVDTLQVAESSIITSPIMIDGRSGQGGRRQQIHFAAGVVELLASSALRSSLYTAAMMQSPRKTASTMSSVDGR